LSVTDLSIFAWGHWPRHTANSTIVRKLGALGRYHFYTPNTTSLNLFNGTVSSTIVTDITDAKSLAVTLTNGNKPEFFVNGPSIGLGSLAQTIPATDGILYVGGPSGEPVAKHDGVLIYPAALSASEIAQLHTWSQARITPRKQWPGGGLRYPDRGDPYTPRDGDPLFLDNIQSARVTLADETSGFLSNTTYNIESGTWAVKEDSSAGERYIECVVAGTLSRRNLDAYGTWKITQDRAIQNATAIYSVTGTERMWNSSGNDGFVLRHRLVTDELALVRITNGSAVAFVGGSAVSGVPYDPRYDFTITRSGAGAWVVYIKGGTYTDWTSIITGTDATHTTSVYINGSYNAGDRLYLDRQFAGVVVP
jgi:hypothetical protein